MRELAIVVAFIHSFDAFHCVDGMHLLARAIDGVETVTSCMDWIGLDPIRSDPIGARLVIQSWGWIVSHSYD